ncbi:UDP-N-acetylmuramoyl-L-alanine--D-glutamate ligase [Arsukibacterium sp.]|uniref:UDP-N-acetylmuramoyl-L-alanine--D-glutamate ligase n=1 Tax=Arsukibacterium sp. TaxID=1977258 RepID=UPI002FD8FB85
MNSLLSAKRIAVVGLGLSGLATVRYLLAQGIKPVLMDTRSKPANLEQIALDKIDGLYLGELDANRLAQMDLIILSPGLSPKHPAIRFARAQGAKVVGDVALFVEANSKPVLAITGSNGKSTVTMLVTAMLQQSGVHALAAGNIGLPVLDALQQTNTEVYVLELSSFQLDTVDQVPSLASCILNISPDHLDRYADLDAYAASKQRIYTNTGLAIYNAADALTYPRAGQLAKGIDLAAADCGVAPYQGEDWLWLDGEPLLATSSMSLSGVHNQFNALASALLAIEAGASRHAIVQTLQSFNGLPHRCQLVAEHRGVRWINDSKATNIGATLAAIAGLKPTVKGELILIAGGDAKGADVTLLQDVIQQQVTQLITLGQDGPAIAALKPNSIQVKDLTTAVRTAARLVRAGDMVLLSPACASLDMFKSYADRGERFAAAVLQELR